MPGPFPISINSIALFYLLPFISVGVYTIGTQKYSLQTSFYSLEESQRFIPPVSSIEKSVTGYIFWILAWAVMLYASYWNNQHEKPYKTENEMLEFVVCFVNRNPFPDKIQDPNKARAIVALVITFLMIIA